VTYERSTAPRGVSLLTIVIPTLNESKSGYLAKILSAYNGVAGIEIICVDGGSADDTESLIKQSKAKLICTDICSRAGRLNEGIKQAKFDMVLLNHPRSFVDIEGIHALIKQASDIRWGAFSHQFSISHPLLNFTSWYSNHIRGDLRGIYYLDHCLFAQKQLLLDVALFPEVDIFEDTEICLRLKKQAKPIRLPFVSLTSAVRFQSQGIYRQALKNQYLKWLYYFKRSDKEMNRLYEKGLELNTEYDKKKSHK
jgi:glycosyltransferase involved in cell wall biosynthesis